MTLVSGNFDRCQLTITWMSIRITFKKISLVTLVSGYLFDSCQFTITWMSIRMSTIMKLNTDCICLGHLASKAWSSQENSQSERAYHCSHIIKTRNGSRKENTVSIVPYVTKTMINTITTYLYYFSNIAHVACLGLNQKGIESWLNKLKKKRSTNHL